MPKGETSQTSHPFYLYPSVHYLYPLNPVQEAAGGDASFLCEKGRAAPWTGCQSITGPHRDEQSCSLTPTGNLEPKINLTYVFLEYGRKPEYLKKSYTRTRRTCKLQTERHLLRLEPGSFVL